MRIIADLILRRIIELEKRNKTVIKNSYGKAKVKLFFE